MRDLVRHMPWVRAEAHRPELREDLLAREWLVTNGLGGYASGTVAGVATRRYHGLLVAALSAPFGRIMTLSHLCEKVRTEPGRDVLIGGDETGAGSDSPSRVVNRSRAKAAMRPTIRPRTSPSSVLRMGCGDDAAFGGLAATASSGPGTSVSLVS